MPWDSSLRIDAKYLKWDPQNAGTHVHRSRDRGRSFERLGTAQVPEVRERSAMSNVRELDAVYEIPVQVSAVLGKATITASKLAIGIAAANRSTHKPAAHG